MITRQFQLLAHEQFSVAAGNAPGGVFTSRPIPYGNEPGFVVIIRVNAAPTGTTPGIVWELDATSVAGGGSGFSRVGGAIAAQTAIGVLTIPYYTSSTQGPIPGGTTFFQIVGTLNALDNVFPDVTVDVVAMD